MMNKLYTIGYGGMDDKTFPQVLIDNEITHIIDVRRKKSGAFMWYFRPGDHIKSILPAGVTYLHWHELGNPFKTLEEYQAHIGAFYCYIRNIANQIEFNPEHHFCLLCAENPAIADDGEVRCHRVYVANELSDMIGVEVMHL